jgi:CspA family cold shock protein
MTPALPLAAVPLPDDDFLSIDDPTHDPRARISRPGHQVSRKETPMPTGTVKFFNADKGYGFIAPDDGGPDSFVHITAVQAAGMQTLDKDQRLNYEVEQGRNGKASAVNLSAA